MNLFFIDRTVPRIWLTRTSQITEKRWYTNDKSECVRYVSVCLPVKGPYSTSSCECDQPLQTVSLSTLPCDSDITGRRVQPDEGWWISLPALPSGLYQLGGLTSHQSSSIRPTRDVTKSQGRGGFKKTAWNGYSVTPGGETGVLQGRNELGYNLMKWCGCVVQQDNVCRFFLVDV